MATHRFYCTSDYHLATTPAFSSGWDSTTSVARVDLTTIQDKVPNITYTPDVVGTHVRIQGVSAPDAVPAGTWTGTARMATRGRSSGLGGDRGPHVIIRVVSGDGLTDRGTLATLTTPPLPTLGTHFEERCASGALAPVTIEEGDRLVIEYGLLNAGTTAGVTTAFSGVADVQLPADDTLFVNGNTSAPSSRYWVELELDEPPDPPTNLYQYGSQENSIQVFWDAPESGPEPTDYEYRINCGPEAGEIFSTGLEIIMAGFVDLEPCMSCTAEVRSVVQTGEGEEDFVYSDWVSLPVSTACPVSIEAYVGNSQVVGAYVGSTPVELFKVGD